MWCVQHLLQQVALETKKNEAPAGWIGSKDRRRDDLGRQGSLTLLLA